MTAPSRLLPVGVALAAAMVGGACSSSGEGSGPAVEIVATDTTCEVARTQLAAGRHSFRVVNRGSDVTEVYVYAAGDRIVAEKERIGPGTEATFSASLDAGTYDIACKPGEKGDGIRQILTVT